MAFFEELANRKSGVTQNPDMIKFGGMIADEEKRINLLYASLGKKYFELHSDSAEPELQYFVNEVNTAKKNIEAYTEQIRILNGFSPCPNCHKDVSNDSAFCSYCGFKIVATDKACCANCGESINPDDVFCINCGTRVSKPIEEETPVVEEAPVEAETAPTEAQELPIVEEIPDEAEEASTVTEETPIAEEIPAEAEEPSAESEEEAVEEVETVADVSDVPRCTNCGEAIEDGAIFCTNCGTRVSKPVEEETSVVEEAPAEIEETPAVTEETPVVEEIPAEAEEPSAEAEKEVVEEVEAVADVSDVPCCTNCGEAIEDGAIFCTNCGTRVAKPEPKVAPAPTFCTNCGYSVEEGSVFCTNCGTRLDR